MNWNRLKAAGCMLASLVAVTWGLAAMAMPTPQQAVKHATSVLLLQRIIQGNQLHSYVKEVWRAGPDSAAAPEVGSEYGRPTPYLPETKHPESEAIVFEFGADRPGDLPSAFRISVTEKRRVPFFLEEVPVVDDAGVTRRMAEEPMHVEDVRKVVKRANPKPKKS